MKKAIRCFTILGLLILAMAFVTACGGNNQADGGSQAGTAQNDGGGATPTPSQTGEGQNQTAAVSVEGLPVGMAAESLLLPRLERPERFTFRDVNAFPEHWNPHANMGTNVQAHMHQTFLSSPFSWAYVPESGPIFEHMNVTATDIRDVTAAYPYLERWGIDPSSTWGRVFVVDIRQDMRWSDGTPINAHSYVRSAQLLLDPQMLNHSATNIITGTGAFVGTWAYHEGEGDWEDVGIYASGDYQLTIIMQNPLNMFDFRQNVTGNFLVHEEMYLAGMQEIEGLLVTNYNTTVETSRFFGPFMVISAELDRQVVMTRNPYWFGWTDSRFDDFYMMTDVVIDVIPEEATRMMLFNQGLLDRIRLTADDLEIHRFSDHLYQWETTNLFRFTFNSDLVALRTMEETAGDGFNRQVLSLRDFRRAISFSIDRLRFTQQATPGWMPSVVLMENYFYDFSNNPASRFRDTEAAMRAIVEFYGFTYGPGTPNPTLRDAFLSITGFNLGLARELFQIAYEEAVASGIYTSGQQINIQLAVGAVELSPTQRRQEDVLNEMLAEATIGTGFEGLVSVTFLGNFPGRFAAVSTGTIEAILTAWGGSMFDPTSILGVYTNTINMGGVQGIHEGGGWDPSIDTLTIMYDWDGTGTETPRTKTFQDWHLSITAGGEFVGDDMLYTRVHIMAFMEAGILNTFQTIPFGIQTISELGSMKINFRSPVYHPIFDDMFGPRNQITFNFTDDAWAEFVASQGGTLNYQ